MLIDPKVGDNVVCVENYDVHGNKNISLDLIYKIVQIRFDGLIVVSNNGKNYGPFDTYRFKSLKEVRKIKLEKLDELES